MNRALLKVTNAVNGHAYRIDQGRLPPVCDPYNWSRRSKKGEAFSAPPPSASLLGFHDLAAFSAKPDRLGQRAPLLGVVGSDHRIV